MVKNLPAEEGDARDTGGSLGGGNGNLLQYSLLGNPTERGDWQATAYEVTKKSDTTYWLNNNKYVFSNNAYVVLIFSHSMCCFNKYLMNEEKKITALSCPYLPRGRRRRGGGRGIS